MKNTQIGKLHLRVETLRVLESDQLATAVGGSKGMGGGSDACTINCTLTTCNTVIACNK